MLKKLIKYTLIFLVVVLGGGAATLFFLLRAPEPEEICDNVFSVLEKELETQLSAALQMSPEEAGQMEIRKILERETGKTYDQCVKDARRRFEHSTQSGLKIARIARCEASAETLEALEACRGD